MYFLHVKWFDLFPLYLLVFLHHSRAACAAGIQADLCCLHQRLTAPARDGGIADLPRPWAPGARKREEALTRSYCYQGCPFLSSAAVVSSHLDSTEICVKLFGLIFIGGKVFSYLIDNSFSQLCIIDLLI